MPASHDAMETEESPHSLLSLPDLVVEQHLAPALDVQTYRSACLVNRASSLLFLPHADALHATLTFKFYTYEARCDDVDVIWTTISVSFGGETVRETLRMQQWRAIRNDRFPEKIEWCLTQLLGRYERALRRVEVVHMQDMDGIDDGDGEERYESNNTLAPCVLSWLATLPRLRSLRLVNWNVNGNYSSCGTLEHLRHLEYDNDKVHLCPGYHKMLALCPNLKLLEGAVIRDRDDATALMKQLRKLDVRPSVRVCATELSVVDCLPSLAESCSNFHINFKMNDVLSTFPFTVGDERQLRNDLFTLNGIANLATVNFDFSRYDFLAKPIPYRHKSIQYRFIEEVRAARCVVCVRGRAYGESACAWSNRVSTARYVAELADCEFKQLK